MTTSRDVLMSMSTVFEYPLPQHRMTCHGDQHRTGALIEQ